MAPETVVSYQFSQDALRNEKEAKQKEAAAKGDTDEGRTNGYQSVD